MPRISDERLKAMMPFFDAHRHEPDVSLAALLRRRMAELAETVLPLTRVYLDTKYWIFLRDAYLDRAADPLHSALLDALRMGVEDGRLLCPISESTYFELTRQRDPELIVASARLMDTLSKGIVIQNTPERVRTEVRDFLLKTVAERSVPDAPCAHVWLKVGHVIGTPVITSGVLEPGEELVAQKSFLDALWNLTLEEMLTDTPPPPDFRDREVETAEAMTRESAIHASSVRSFKKLHEAELAGFWDAHESTVRDALVFLYQAAHPGAEPPSPAELQDSVRLYKNVLRNVIHFGKARTSLPTAQIISGLHAIVRWNRNRGFKATDTYDFHHAAAALPYCDVFLTERFLHKILVDPPLSFAEHFHVRISSQEEEALAILAA